MGLDQLFELTSQVASTALPILGVIVLIFLAIFVKHLICVMKSANEAVISMKKTLDTTNRQLETLDKPLNTLNELSETVDCVHEASKTAVRSTIVTVIENFSSIKDWVMSVVSKDKTNGKTPADEEGE
ncbi:histidine kinase [Amedibacillus sp. YH-ame10]